MSVLISYRALISQSPHTTGSHKQSLTWCFSTSLFKNQHFVSLSLKQQQCDEMDILPLLSHLLVFIENAIKGHNCDRNSVKASQTHHKLTRTLSHLVKCVAFSLLLVAVVYIHCKKDALQGKINRQKNSNPFVVQQATTSLCFPKPQKQSMNTLVNIQSLNSSYGSFFCSHMCTLFFFLATSCLLHDFETGFSVLERCQ